MSKSFPEWWKHGQKVRTASDGILTLNISEDAEYWLTNDAGKEVSVFSADILGPASTPEACRMTTDITELALSNELRNKVNHRLYGALDFQGTSGEHAKISLSIDECKSVIAAFDERLALVEALEKAQAQSSKWLEAYHKAVSIGARYEERIAELESRTVKLPKKFKTSMYGTSLYEDRDILKMLTDAGIKWEAE